MKIADGYNKLRGGYYTPKKIADFLSAWAIRSINDKILEPSCGDGSFLESIVEQLTKMGCDETSIKQQVLGIELDALEANKALNSGAGVQNIDFFTIYKQELLNKRKFNVILGNPPFIRYQNVDKEIRDNAFELLKIFGFKPNKMTNIWMPFLNLSCQLLNNDGKLGMVIPAELFQVDYAAETRQFLVDYFEQLTIITFKELVFDGIQQEVILLLGERTSDNKGIRVIELENLDCLQTLIVDDIQDFKELDHTTEKWTKYYLTNFEINLLRSLNKANEISDANELFKINVGLVSGENDFFVINHSMVEKFNLHDSYTSILSRSEQTKGISLTSEDFSKLQKSDKRVYLFVPYQKNDPQILDFERKYIEFGVEKEFNKNYKCRIRKQWECVPLSWRPQAFLIRQANMYPRMILNSCDVLVTDTLHKIEFNDNVIPTEVCCAFLNSYTLALSETIGRSYGGGVLTFEPGEVRKLRIPMKNANMLDFDTIDKLQRKGDIESILDYTDEILLKQGLGLSDTEIRSLRDIWHKMKNRRIGRKKRT